VELGSSFKNQSFKVSKNQKLNNSKFQKLKNIALFKDSKFQKLCNFQKVNNSKIQKSLYYMLMIVQTRRSTSLIFAKFEFLKRVN